MDGVRKIILSEATWTPKTNNVYFTLYMDTRF